MSLADFHDAHDSEPRIRAALRPSHLDAPSDGIEVGPEPTRETAVHDDERPGRRVVSLRKRPALEEADSDCAEVVAHHAIEPGAWRLRSRDRGLAFDGEDRLPADAAKWRADNGTGRTHIPQRSHGGDSPLVERDQVAPLLVFSDRESDGHAQKLIPHKPR